MKEYLNKLEIFQKAFNQTVNNSPVLVSPQDYNLRFKLLEEENLEYLEACETGNMVELVDALGDKLFVLLGTIVTHGCQHIIEEVFNEITGSNMSKLDNNGKAIINGQNGFLDERKPLGKVLKSENFYTPNLEKILEKHSV